MKRNNLLKVATSGLILFSSFNDIYAEEDRRVLNLDPFRVEIVGNRMNDADSEKIFRYAEYMYKNKRYNEAAPYLKNIKEYSSGDVVDNTIYMLAGIYLKNIASFDYAFTLLEQIIFMYPDGDIIQDGHVKGTLESIIDLAVNHNDYSHATWAFNILTYYPGISKEVIEDNRTKLEGLFKKDISDISFTYTVSGGNYSKDYSPASAKFGLFEKTANKFRFFDSVRAQDLIIRLSNRSEIEEPPIQSLAIKLIERDEVSPRYYKCPMTNDLLYFKEKNYVKENPQYYYLGSKLRINPNDWITEIEASYKEGTILEDFLKDIGIKDPMKWWETLE